MANTTILLNGFSILGGANTNVSQNDGGQLKIHDGDAVFESDDIIVIEATNVSEDGTFSYDTVITSIVVYDSASDYFHDIPQYTYEPVDGSEGISLDPGQHGNAGMGDRYLQFDAGTMVSTDPDAPELGELVVVAGVDLISAMANKQDINVGTFEDIDYSNDGMIDPGSAEPADAAFSAANNIFSGVVCFAKGTLIETENGPLPIEVLRAGDLVRTLDNGLQEIRWIGSTTVRGTGGNTPIKFRAGALGNVRDLLVSPNHRMLVTGAKAQLLFGMDQVLVAAKHLIDDRMIRPAPREMVQYFHFLFDRHEIVFAEACPAESLHPGKETFKVIDKKARREILDYFPELVDEERELSRYELNGREARAMLKFA